MRMSKLNCLHKMFDCLLAMTAGNGQQQPELRIDIAVAEVVSPLGRG